jgi:hypothetical protein
MFLQDPDIMCQVMQDSVGTVGGDDEINQVWEGDRVAGMREELRNILTPAEV